MPEIKSNRQRWGRDFPVGGEWDAGLTPPHLPRPLGGRWSVRREETRFVVVFHRFSDQSETLLAEFPPSESGELDAKLCAIEACQALRIPSISQGETPCPSSTTS
jgi:hypothetical protein